MADTTAGLQQATQPQPWHAGAAYLYVLHLDGPALAWEFLRRHPRYTADWRADPSDRLAAQHWGLRTLENPALDARDAMPDWLGSRSRSIRVIPDDEAEPHACPFEFWRLPGRKQLQHDGRGLVLATHWPGRCLRLKLAPELQDGMPHAFAVRACSGPCTQYRDMTDELGQLAAASRSEPVAAALPRPTASAVQALQMLQALDAARSGASLREIAEGLFGAAEVAADWHADSAIRARVRRLVQRGRSMVYGGYRELVGLDQPTAAEQGRTARTADRP